MKTAVMTDSNSGITAEEAQNLGIFVLPMPVLMDGRCYLEGIDIQQEQLYKAMKRECKVSTSQPSPGSVEAMWTSIFEAGYDEIVHIPMSSGLSGSCQSAALLAGEFGKKVYVVDNRRISITQRGAVLEAKKMADAGNTAAEIQKHLEDTAFQASIYLTVSSLKYLQMGGRLSQSAAMLGTILNIKPVLSIQGKQIDVVDKVRGIKASEQKMIGAIQKDIAERFAGISAQQLQIAIAGTLQSQEEISQWLEAVQTAFPGWTIDYSPLPCSIACHVGPGCMGIAVWQNHYGKSLAVKGNIL
ncbi:MAG: DegV family protein [Oscillospiraceae bacterium]